MTVAPTAIGPGSGGTPTRIPVPFRPETDEPTPPSEVPEASTWLMMLVGLATVGAWWAWRRRAVGAAGP